MITIIIQRGARIIIEHNLKEITSKISAIEKFDVIAFKESVKDQQYIKRVIGLPGDNVEMIDGVLYINGNSYEEPNVKGNNKNRSRKITGDFSLKELTGYEISSRGIFVCFGR